ncbi:peptidase [Pseudoruegeria sp. SHC-113]|uniref:peptidase n=1 Tax=Pseudoruegeria sp. SHC-113 TaxID=2855439 RepID=UPI0021BBA40F|nr:peptidase [Pseudoruegeria sp. SHC-113]MCT8160128.1 peptidase [Pseudoruegeria sp. SHC-113]
MSGPGAAIVAEARLWLGTPYVHQASCRGGGADCLGLLRGVWRGVVGQEPAPVPPYTADWNEAARSEALWEAARGVLCEKPLCKAAPGDVLLFRMRQGGVAKHLGLQSLTGSAPAFIHAYTGHGVIESPLSAPWARRLVARFAFPDTLETKE